MQKIKKYIPNILTFSRILLTPFMVYLGFTNHIKILIGIAIVIAFTDFFDGFLARKWQVQSNLGAKLDAISDKILIIGLLIILILRNYHYIYMLLFECLIAFFNSYVFLKKGIAGSLMIGKIKMWFVLFTIIIGLFDLVVPSWNIPVLYFIWFTVAWQIITLIAYIKNYIDCQSKKKVLIEEYQEFYEIVKPILDHPEFQKRKEYMHHVGESVYAHTLRVAFDSYKIAKKFGWDYKAAAIGGILHDFYDKPWQTNHEKKPFFQKHGFVHAEEARKNALKYFPEKMNPKIEDIIKKHMFPLNKRPQKYKESWLISFVDKADSMDFITHPSMLFRIFFGKEIKNSNVSGHKYINILKKKLHGK